MNTTAPLTDKFNALECLAACEDVYARSTIATDDCHVLIQPFDTFTHVTFRGSKSIEDWLNDADFEKITVAGGKVHRGIWMSYQTVSSLLRSKLNKQKPLVIDGHSLGGGHSTFCAWDLDAEYEIFFAISFGSPRVADAAFRDNYNRTLGEKTIRFVDARDIVPRVPFRELGYVHVGHEGFLPSAGGFSYDPSLWELVTDDVKGAITDIQSGRIELLDDHHLLRYRARIMALSS